MNENFEKHSILIISDFPNWAYHEIQLFIVESLNEEFDFYYDFLRYNGKKKSLNPKVRINNFFDHKKFSKLKKDNHYDIVLYLGFYFDELMEINWCAKKIIKGIYTDGFPPSNSSYSGDFAGFFKRYLKTADAIVCGSKTISDFYESRFPKVYNANLVLDSQFFKRKNTNHNKSNFTIGWTGNPNREFKGYYSHILPAVEKLKTKYPDVEFISRFSGPMDTLPQFYENIDVVVIASEADAGPSLFGEASLMDIPSVSTNIGWPSEVINDGINGFIVQRTIEDIFEKLQLLYLDRLLLKEMSLRIRKDYQNHFNKSKMINNWRSMFNEVINK